MKAIEEEQKSITDEPELYNSRAIRAYVSYVKKEYPYIDINDLLNYSGIEPNEVEDNKEWFTQKQVNLFRNKIEELTDNENIGYDAGIFSAAPEALGNYREYLLSFLSPRSVFKNINSIAKTLTRSCEYSGKKIGQNSVEIRVVPNENVKEIKMQCDNRRGYFAGVLQLFNITKFNIDHPECMFENNGQECRYIITWESSRVILRNIFRFLPYFLIIIVFSIQFYISIDNFIIFIIILLVFILKDLIDNKLQNKKIRTAYRELMNEIENNYSSSRVILSVAESLSNENNNIFDIVISFLSNQLGYNRGVIMIASETHPQRLCYKISFGYNIDEIEAWNEQNGFNVSQSDSQGAFVVAYREKRPILVSDMQKIKSKLSERSQKLVERLNVKALICCPIIFKENVYGIMAIDQKSDNIPFRQSDRNLLMSIARLLGIAINNVNQKKEKEILKAKAAAKEAREDFARRAMHNMRNPLDAIRTYIACIKRDFTDINNDLKDIIVKVELNAKRIGQLTEDFSRWDKPLNMRKEVFSPNIIIQEVINSFESNKNQISIIYNPTELLINVDKSSLKWIIEEMITNAQKNNAKKISIDVEHNGNRIKMFFRDDGNGIKEEIRKKIFEPYETTDYMGTGLGLACIKKMIEEHNGSVFFENNSFGATFVIDLPFN